MKKYFFSFLLIVFGILFFSVSSAHAATLYYNNAAADGDWNNLANWWTDAGFSIPASDLPTITDDVILSANVDTNNGKDASVNTLTVTGSSDVSIDISVANGAVFNGTSYLINRTLTGDATFNNSSYNVGTITGNAIFTYASGGSITLTGDQGWGTVTGTVAGGDTTPLTEFIFRDNSYANGPISGNATFYDSSYNAETISGNATFYNTSLNRGVVSGNATFHNSSYNQNNVTGDAIFYDTSYNDVLCTFFCFFGSVGRNATFYDSSYNNGTVVGNAIFYNDSAQNFGEVDGTKTRYFIKSAFTSKDFVSTAPWTVVADGVDVDIIRATYDGTTTLTELNGGHFITDSELFVTTDSASQVRTDAATLNGVIQDDGGDSVTDHGFIYGTDPTLTNNPITISLGTSGIGEFSHSISNLNGFTYYYKAYATNLKGTVYGGVESFSILTPTIYWYKNGSDSRWTTLSGNWWTDVNHSIQAGALPTSADIVFTLGTIGPNVDLDSWVEPANIDANNTGINFTSENYGTISVPIAGSVIFNGTSINYSTVFGNVTFNDDSVNQGCNNFCPPGAPVGNIVGNATFNDSSKNVSLVSGNATFNDSSQNYHTMMGWSSGVVSGDAIFNNNSWNDSNVEGNAIFNGSSFNNGTVSLNATFNNSSYNTNVVSDNATFNDFSYNKGAVIILPPFLGVSNITPNFAPPGGGGIGNNGSVLGNAILNGYSYNQSSISGDAVFNDKSFNSGTVDTNASFYDSTNNENSVLGDACFATTATNNGTVGGNRTVCSASAPVVSTSSILTINSTSSSLLGNITDTGGESASEVGFDYGLTNTYGSTVSKTGAFVRGTFGVVASSLACDTTYHYRAYATNSVGTSHGEDAIFNTPSCTSPDQVLYGIDGAGVNPDAPNLYTIDPTTGAKISTIGPVGEYITGLAFNPLTGILYGSSGNMGDDQKGLFTIDTTTGASTFLGTIGEGFGKNARFHVMPDIAFRSDGRLYGVSNDSTLYTIDISSCDGSMCQTTAVGSTGLSSSGNGLAFDSNDNLYLFGNYDNSYYQLNPDTGAVIAENIFTNPSQSLKGGISLGAAKLNKYDVPFAARTDGGDSPYDLIIIDPTTHAIVSTGADNEDMLYISALAFSPVAPVVVSDTASSITKAGATLQGEIINTGGRQVTERGFEWGTVNGDTTLVKETSGPYNVGEFSASIADLQCGATYRFRAYATNAQGTDNGEWVTFDMGRCTISGGNATITTPPVTTPPVTTETVCPAGDKYSSTTGLLCTSFTTPSTNPTNSTTPTAPVCSITHTLLRGSTGAEVKCLQQGLNTRLNTNLIIDGIFGPKTTAAVIKFQLAHNLKGDGIFGILSRAAWNK